jgi:hypothetical protein
VSQRKRRRRDPPGTHWKVLAQDSEGAFKATSEMYDRTFDELVLDRWLHLEQMDTNYYWMQLGPLHLNIALKPNGDVDIGISRECLDYGGVVRVTSNVDTNGKRLKAEPLRPQWNNNKPVSGWRRPE